MKSTAIRDVRTESQAGTSVLPASWHILLALVPLGAFGLYWLSSFLVEARNGTTHFGADTWFYAELAKGNVFDRIGDNYLGRIFKFHPTTAVMGAVWMQIVGPLTPWIAPHHLLTGMFAAAGAIGVWAAMWAFAAVVPRRYVALWGAIYATSLGVWYFSSVQESKIVTATLSALYIATYLHLRARWTTGRALLLTAILLLACLNEIVSGFLVIIPVVDTLVQRGWDLHRSRWIALHALAAPLALVFLEVVVIGWLVPPGAHPEGATHFSMLMWYLSRNYFDAAGLYAFAVRWLFFNIAAPERHASHWANPAVNYGGDFEPKLANYLSSPVSAGLVAVFAVMLIASLLLHHRSESARNPTGLLLALLAYAVLRGVFFFIFNPYECLLFSPGVTLAHLLLLGIPFTASSFPAKQILLLVFALLLFLTNGAFIIG